MALDTGGTFLAGGTDVFVAMHAGTFLPETLISLSSIDELREVRFDDDGLVFGSLVNHRFFELNTFVRDRYTAIYEGCANVGSPQIRNRGTVGGNLCNGLPSVDSAGPLLVFDAVLTIAGVDYERSVPLNDFYLGPKRTVLQRGELLKSIFVPKPADNSTSCYIKYTRRNAMDLALLGVSVYLALDTLGVIADTRIALTTAGPTPIRASKAEMYLVGEKPSEALFARASLTAESEALPRTSWRASKEFRLKLVEVLTKRALDRAYQRAVKK